jgi:hypothetical protein
MSGEKQYISITPGAPPVEGIGLEIEESTERWSEIKLSDGSILRVKPVVVSVARIDGIRDPEGNPMYWVKTTPVIAVAKGPANQP